MIKVALPTHLRTLASITDDVELDVPAPVTADSILDTLENRYPMLRGAIREHVTKKRRAFLRFFACGEDISHEPTDKLLPPDIISGKEVFWIVGAIAGG